MPVNALQSLINICGASKPLPQTEPPVDAPPIASFGFWANPSVPLSAGVGTPLPARQPPAPRPAQPAPAPLLSTLALSEELEVRDRLAEAKELAEVGGDIRWDLIIAEAAKLPCGLGGQALPSAAMEEKKLEKGSSDDDEDHRSTSASGSGVSGEVHEAEPEVDASSNDEKDEPSRPAKDAIFSDRLPPWRRSRAAVKQGDCKEQEVAPNAAEGADATASPPWRRALAAKGRPAAAGEDAAARVYSVATMLQCLMLMRQRDVAETDAAKGEEGLRPTPSPAAPSVPAAEAGAAPREAGAGAGGLANAPWRRRPRAAGAAPAPRAGE